jgi:glucose/arabinose dehydrogenase
MISVCGRTCRVYGVARKKTKGKAQYELTIRQTITKYFMPRPLADPSSTTPVITTNDPTMATLSSSTKALASPSKAKTLAAPRSPARRAISPVPTGSSIVDSMSLTPGTPTKELVQAKAANPFASNVIVTSMAANNDNDNNDNDNNDGNGNGTDGDDNGSSKGGKEKAPRRSFQLFQDESASWSYRRLAFSPDGTFLVLPTGQFVDLSPSAESDVCILDRFCVESYRLTEAVLGYRNQYHVCISVIEVISKRKCSPLIFLLRLSFSN